MLKLPKFRRRWKITYENCVRFYKINVLRIVMEWNIEPLIKIYYFFNAMLSLVGNHNAQIWHFTMENISVHNN